MRESRGRLLRMPNARAEARGAADAGEAAEIERLTAELDAVRQELRVTRARLAEAEARADIDPLVDALNRRGFERELVRAIAYARRYGTPAALVYLDLDAFKPVNDRHGHDAGDAVLRGVAALLTASVRASDVVARLGGDEFAVLLWNLGEGQACAKAAALTCAVAGRGFRWDGRELWIGASAGVTMLRADDTPAASIARADATMYRAKRQGSADPST